MRIIRILCLVIVLCVVEVIIVGNHHETASTEAAGQDAVYLNQRISTLELRLNSIESSLRTLQQQQMISQQPAQTQPLRDPEVSLLRSEVELLKGRVRMLECGLMHLDERTLSAGAKEARRKARDQFADPCRINPETPLQLSTQR